MLKNLLAKIIKAAITAGERKLDKIGNTLLRRIVLFFVGAAEAILLALLDDDKDNEAQIARIAKEQLTGLVGQGAQLGKERIGKFKDPKLANAISEYIDGTEEVLKALLDENPDNEAQVLAIWQRRKKAFFGDGLDIATDHLAERIRAKIKDPILAGVIIEVLQSLDDLVKEERIAA